MFELVSLWLPKVVERGLFAHMVWTVLLVVAQLAPAALHDQTEHLLKAWCACVGVVAAGTVMLPPGQLPPGAVAQMHLVPGGPHPGAPHPAMMGQMGAQGETRLAGSQHGRLYALRSQLLVSVFAGHQVGVTGFLSFGLFLKGWMYKLCMPQE